MQRPAFTLIELIAVLAIMVVLTSIVGLTLRPHFDRVYLGRATDRIVDADALCRQNASRQPVGQVSLSYDKNRHRLECGDRTWTLPRQATIDFFWPGEVGQGTVSTRQMQAISFSSNGTSSSYVVRIEVGDSQRWLTFLGISGQALISEDVRTALEPLQ